MGSVLLGDLEKVGWVVLKCDYEITNGGEQRDYFYHMNNININMNINGVYYFKAYAELR